jgi:heme A synthase
VTVLRRLSLVALALAFAQVVFGAVVRITGSGMGCGDHWPKCAGYWVPPLDRTDLIIEVTHRYLAVAIGIAVIALLIAAWRRRGEPGVSGRGGVLRAATLAVVLVGVVGALGRFIVAHELNPALVVVHLALAMSVLAVLAVAAVRAGAFGARSLTAGASSARTARAAGAAAALTFVVLTFGALTANLPGAAAACQGFPLCNDRLVSEGGATHTQLTHRLLAFLLFFHVLGVTIAVSRRRESPLVVRAVRLTMAAIVAQIVIAAALVELFLPPALQSLHQAMGTLVWLTVVVFAALAHRGSRAAVPAPVAAGGVGTSPVSRLAPAPPPAYPPLRTSGATASDSGEGSSFDVAPEGTAASVEAAGPFAAPAAAAEALVVEASRRRPPPPQEDEEDAPRRELSAEVFGGTSEFSASGAGTPDAGVPVVPPPAPEPPATPEGAAPEPPAPDEKKPARGAGR